MSTILITDSLFIGKAEEQTLTAAGYAIERLDKVAATEDELVHVIKHKVGYILGGIESVTERVIENADSLRVIAFTGSGYSEFIPAWRQATQRGIAISAAKGGNAPSVAEWTLAAALSLIRNIPAMTAAGGPSFATTREFGELVWGVIGSGNVGREVAKRAVALGMRVLATPSQRGEVTGAVTASVEQILTSADIVTVHVSKERGHGVLSGDAIAQLRPGAVLVNASFREAVDNESLIKRLYAGKLRAAVDYKLDAPGAPVGVLLSSNAQTAFNTLEANKRISQRVTASILNILRTGNDPDLINPDYKLHTGATRVT